MRLKGTFLSCAIAATFLLAGLLPPTEAEPPTLAVGVVSTDLSLEGLPANAMAERLAPEEVTSRRLATLDVLVLDAPGFAAAWSSSTARGAIMAFLRDGGALVAEGGPDVFSWTDAPRLSGVDVPADLGASTLPVDARAAGLYRTSGGAWAYAAMEYGARADFRGGLVAEAAVWLNSLEDFQPRVRSTLGASAGDANWQFWGSASYAYTWSPYGRIAYVADFYYAISDGTSTYDWWTVRMSQTSSPGTYLWGNAWRTNVGWVVGDQDEYVDSNELVDWGPGSVDASGQTLNLAFAVGMIQGVDGAPFTDKRSFGYTVDDHVVTQGSSSSSELAFTRHVFGYDSGPANGVWTNKPAWTVRVYEGQCLKIPFQNKVEWRNYDANSYYTSWINSWREICK